MTKILRRSGINPNSWHVRTALLAVCAFAALFILRHIASNSSKVKRLAEALQTCRDDSGTAVTNPTDPDPLAAQTVYVPVPCNESVSAEEQAAAKEADEMRDLHAEIEKLQKSLTRKDELLRVRNNQLVEAYDVMESRTKLWNESSFRLEGSELPAPDYLGVVAVVSDYWQVGLRQAFRDAWYAHGDAEQLKQDLGMRMVFVLGKNPTMVTDGTGIAHDTEEVQKEVDEHDDILRVHSVHSDGTWERSEMVYLLWQALPAKFSAYFYAKVQIGGLPSPLGFAQLLMQYDASDATYAGCMKSGPVINDWKSPWYEPQHWKFGANGGDHNYMLHAAATGYVLSRSIATHVSKYSSVLARYANEDVMVGSWMIGLNVEHSFDSGLCCSNADNCQFNADALLKVATATQKYMNAGGVPAKTGKGKQRRLAGAGEAHCALHTASCNGVCGLTCTDACETDGTWKKFRECVRTA